MKCELTSAGLLGSVTERRQTNGGAGSTVRQVQYAYYDGTQPNDGNLGDLMTATVLDGNNVLDTSYYRYYKSGDPSGYSDGLKYVFNPDSYLRLTAALGTNLGSLIDALRYGAVRCRAWLQRIGCVGSRDWAHFPLSLQRFPIRCSGCDGGLCNGILGRNEIRRVATKSSFRPD